MKRILCLIIVTAAATQLAATGVISGAQASPNATCGPGCDSGGCTNYIYGNDANNTLTGTAGSDCMYGYGGNDRILGLAGNDILFGGPGADELFGGVGSDNVLGESGQDEINGGCETTAPCHGYDTDDGITSDYCNPFDILHRNDITDPGSQAIFATYGRYGSDSVFVNGNDAVHWVVC